MEPRDMFGGGFDMSALEEMLGGGPELQDFVSESPADLPSFDSAARLFHPPPRFSVRHKHRGAFWPNCGKQIYRIELL